MRFIVIIVLALVSVHSFSESVQINAVEYVYELGGVRNFDFSGRPRHQCGSNIYRATAGTVDSINRKFSLVLSAFMANKKLLVDTGLCEGSRLKVGWVRLIH